MKKKTLILTAIAMGLMLMTTNSKQLPRGIRNNNPGNIEDNTKFMGMVGSDGRFAIYETPFYGIRAIGRQLKLYRDRDGINTIAGIISRWAPDTENDTANYIRFVSERAAVPEFAPLAPSDYPNVIAAMIQLENGQQPYDLALLQNAVSAGLNS